jgi:hypothetical protein
MASVVYNSAKSGLMDGTIDLDTNTFYTMLVTSSYSPNIDSHIFRSSVSNEVSGTGYTSGGAQITGLSVATDTSGDAGWWDGNDVSWASSTITARGAVVYKSTGASSTDNLICYFDFGSDQTSTNGTFTIQWSTSGIIRLT